MRRQEINDVVRLGVARPDQGLRAGAIGTVLERFDAPSVAYEVEFVGEDGRSIVQLTLTQDQLADDGQRAA